MQPILPGACWTELVFASICEVCEKRLIRSFGAVPRTRFVRYQRIMMLCQGLFCHWEFRDCVCKGLAELQYKENP